jgi:hypothetical protein
MTPFNHEERELIAVFLTDVFHHKDIRKRMEMLSEKLPKERVLEVIGRLEGQGALSSEDAAYLRKKIEKLYA